MNKKGRQFVMGSKMCNEFRGEIRTSFQALNFQFVQSHNYVDLRMMLTENQNQIKLIHFSIMKLSIARFRASL